MPCKCRFPKWCCDCGSSSDEDEESRRNKERSRKIDQQIAKEKQLFMREINLLLLGASESGKSTFLKQMKIISGTEFDRPQLVEFRNIVYLNVIRGMKVLIDARKKLKIPWSDEKNDVFAEKFLSVPDNYNRDPESFCSIAHLVEKLWAEPAIKTAFARRIEFQLPDSVKYFFENLDNLAKIDYLPSNADILHARRATKTIIEYRTKINKVPFRFIDVGGQRSQRQKWFQCFYGVTSVIYMISSSEYDQALLEDCVTNRIDESLVIFNTIVNHRAFAETSFILFLNKTDLLREKLQILEATNRERERRLSEGNPPSQDIIVVYRKYYSQPNLEPTFIVASRENLHSHNKSVSPDSQPRASSAQQYLSPDWVPSDSQPRASSAQHYSTPRSVSPDSQSRSSSAQHYSTPRSVSPDSQGRASSAQQYLTPHSVSPDSQPDLSRTQQYSIQQSILSDSQARPSSAQQLTQKSVSPDSQPRPSSAHHYLTPHSVSPDSQSRSSSAQQYLTPHSVSPEPQPDLSRTQQYSTQSISCDSKARPSSAQQLTQQSVSPEPQPGSSSEPQYSTQQSITSGSQSRMSSGLKYFTPSSCSHNHSHSHSAVHNERSSRTPCNDQRRYSVRTYGDYFPNFYGNPFSVEDVQSHMYEMFRRKMVDNNCPIYPHFTTAVDTENISLVFQAVRCTILRKSYEDLMLH